MNPLVLQLGIAVVASVGSAFLAVHLALHRFYREKWWERRLAAYLAIMEALHGISSCHVEWADQWITDREPSNEAQNELRLKNRLALAELRKSRDLGEFLISSNAVSEIESFLRDMESTRTGDAWSDYENISCLADNTLGKIRTIAQTDLQLDANWGKWMTLVRMPRFLTRRLEEPPGIRDE